MASSRTERVVVQRMDDATGPDVYDLILVGGGLANCLIAWRVAQRQPAPRVLIVEQADRLGGNHTWSFHDADLTTTQHQWLAPLIAYAWDRHEVRFPDLRRTLYGGYRAITSARLHERMVARAVAEVRCSAAVVALAPEGVRLASGEFIRAHAVIDGRGPRASQHWLLGFQKFLGLEVELSRPHGLTMPVIMDATVSQADGYRFLYVLPLDGQRLLVEDTRYSDGEALDEPTLRREALAYIDARGWQVSRVAREERGVLPILLAGDFDAFWREGVAGVARSGLNAALFHPTTGYSLPYAVRLADAIVSSKDLSGPTLAALSRRHAEAAWRRGGFFRLLNRMLFRAGAPDQRYRVLERFYRLPEPLIERFYAGRPTVADKCRLLMGKPPVPVLAAIGCVSEGALLRRELRNA